MNERDYHNYSELDNLKKLSLLDAADLLLQLPKGKESVLNTLAEKGERLVFQPPLNTPLTHAVFLLTNPQDVQSVWADNFNRLNKLGPAYDGLRDLFGRGLIPIETGPEWKSRQRLLGKYMQPKNLPHLESFTNQYLDTMLEDLNPKDNDECVFDNINKSLAIASFQLAAKSFLGKDASKEEALTISKNVNTMNRLLTMNALMGGVPNSIYKRTPLFLREVHEAENAFKKYVLEALKINENKSSELIKALNEAGPQHKGILTEENIRDEVMISIIASFISTATSIGWGLYFVSRPEYSNYQKIIREETASKNFSDSSMASMVIKEGLRLYPPVYVAARKVTQNISVNNQLGTLEIPKESTVLISPYMTHRNRKYWDEPEVFNPLRFQNPPVEGSYIPFGIGQRRCIGEHYALKVATHSLRHILSNYQIKLLKSPVPVFKTTLHPSYDFAIKAHKIR